jgi:hypothetical protein
VSKILRLKDKILSGKNGDQSPMKRTKGKVPDIERALSNWARNQLRLGLPLDDDLIRDRASFFAHTVGNSKCPAKVNSSAWLENFDQKNYLNGFGAKAREISCEADDFDDVDGISIGELKSGSRTPNGISPNSPDALHHSRFPKPEKVEPPDGYVDYRRTQSKNASSLASCYSDTTVSTSRLPPLAGAASRPHRQIFPATGAGAFVTDLPVSEPPPLEYSHPSMAIPTLESPLEETEDSPLGLDSAVNHFTQQSHQTTPILSPNPFLMGPPPHPAPSSHSSRNPPSQNEARHAIETLVAFLAIQPSNAVDPHEYILMGKLMEKLKLQGSPLLSGIRRKRSIHSL